MVRLIEAQYLRGARIGFYSESTWAAGTFGRNLPCPTLSRTIFRLATATLPRTDIYMCLLQHSDGRIARAGDLFDKFNGLVLALLLHPWQVVTPTEAYNSAVGHM